MSGGSRAGDGILQRARKRFREWVNRRIPPSRVVTLDQRRIFIFPSRAGFFFGLCLLLMLTTAVNYQNNMTYALTFLLGTLFVVATLHTYANLSGLTIRALRAQPAFPGQQTEFDIQLERTRKRDHFALYLKWPESTDALVNLVEGDSTRVKLHNAVGGRGWFSPGRLLLESSYPLGLLRCWTWIDLDLYALVYPQPLPSSELPGLRARIDLQGGGGLPSPVALDVLSGRWPVGPFQAVFSANTAHIMSWQAVCAMFRGIGPLSADSKDGDSTPRILNLSLYVEYGSKENNTSAKFLQSSINNPISEFSYPSGRITISTFSFGSPDI